MAETNGLPHGGAPNQFVAENATKPDMLPMREVALLGVSGPDDDMKALIRMSDGSIIMGGLQEKIALGRLLEITPAGVVIEHASGFATFLRPYPYGDA